MKERGRRGAQSEPYVKTGKTVRYLPTLQKCFVRHRPGLAALTGFFALHAKQKAGEGQMERGGLSLVPQFGRFLHPDTFF